MRCEEEVERREDRRMRQKEEEMRWDEEEVSLSLSNPALQEWL